MTPAIPRRRRPRGCAPGLARRCCSRSPRSSRPAAPAPPASGVVSLATTRRRRRDPSAAPSASVDPEEAMQAFEACMQRARRRHPGRGHRRGRAGRRRPAASARPRPGDAGRPSRTAAPGQPIARHMQAADEACRDLLPAGGMGDPNATMDPELADQLLEFAQCMRDHGIDFPDPQFDGGGVTVQIGGPDGEGIDPDVRGVPGGPGGVRRRAARRRPGEFAARAWRRRREGGTRRRRRRSCSSSRRCGRGSSTAYRARDPAWTRGGRERRPGPAAETPRSGPPTVEQRTMQTAAELDGTLGYEGALVTSRPGAAGTRHPAAGEGTVIERGERPVRARRQGPAAAALRRPARCGARWART